MSTIHEIPAELENLLVERSTNDQTSTDNTVDGNISTISKTVYVSLLWYDKKIGAAFYDSESAIINVLLDCVESDPFENVQRLIEELEPEVVITSAKADSRFLNVIKKYCVDEDETSIDQSQCSIRKSTLEMLPSLDYSYVSCKSRILRMKLPGMEEDLSETEKNFYLTSLLPFDCFCSVRALGGLLKYLHKNRVGVGLEKPEIETPISSIETITLKNVLFVDKCSMEALQVFYQISHPSVYKSSSKEGLSLFGLLNRTLTRSGQKLLRSWFHRPTSDPVVLKRRHDVISFFCNSRNIEVTRCIRDSLKRVGNVTRILSRLRTSKLSVNDWLCLIRTSQNALQIVDACRAVIFSAKNHVQIPELLQDVIKYFTNDLATIVTAIDSVMDFESSKREGIFTVSSGISPDLDELRENYAKLPTILTSLADSQLKTYCDHISTCQVVYMRRIGYLLFIHKTAEMKQSNNLFIPGTEFIAESKDTAYYKTPATILLDENFGDILEDISVEQVKIGDQLQNIIGQYSEVLLKVSSICSELDCLLALATVAIEFNYVCPIFTDKKQMKVTNARHPLQEHTMSLFVPNDINLEEESGCVKVITGPNACGKSVYLKQVGLIAFMVHIGSFVPADKAEIGKISRIYTKISSVDSIASGMSAFASDLAQISQALNKASNNSLVLIDEFGTGTSTVDGKSLLHACLSYWASKPDTPLVVCATHFREMYATLKSPSVQFLTMEVIESDVKGEIVCLHQLIEGSNDFINSSQVAMLAGVPSEIVARGHEVAKMMRDNVPIRQYNHESAVAYQRKCKQVAENAAVCNFKDKKECSKLLEYVKMKLATPESSKKRNFSCVDS